jgi:hypothetical protein
MSIIGKLKQKREGSRHIYSIFATLHKNRRLDEAEGGDRGRFPASSSLCMSIVSKLKQMGGESKQTPSIFATLHEHHRLDEADGRGIQAGFQHLRHSA